MPRLVRITRGVYAARPHWRRFLPNQLIEMNADPFVFHPGDVAWSLNVVAFYKQCEGIWNSDRASDFKTCP